MKLLKFDRKTFENRFGSKSDCYQHLAELKWSKGYECRRCKSIKYIKGKQPFSRRCSKCGFDESTTAFTLFHKLKFDIDKAFGMLYEISTSKKGASSIWLAERFGVQQNTAWLFRQKIQRAMKSSQKHPLDGDVHVDEFEIGTPQKEEQGRSHSDHKVRIVLAVEDREGKSGRAYAKVIDNFSSASIKPIFTDHIDQKAHVITDGWSAYKAFRGEYRNLTQIPSNKGKNFPMLHIQIRNFKNWLRGVHSYCDRKYLQNYINEYFFRFNRRNHRESILDKLIERCVLLQPITKKQLYSCDLSE
jgi:transposase-like protein